MVSCVPGDHSTVSGAKKGDPMTAPANHTWSFTISLPGGSTSVSVSAICSGGHQYDQVGWTNGPAISIPSSATTLTATWGCSTQQVYPGPYITGCSAQSYSYS